MKQKIRNRRGQYRLNCERAIQAVRWQHARLLGEVEGPTSAADVDFYVMAIWQLRETARLTLDRANGAPELREALATFEGALPHFKWLRNNIVHTPTDAGELASVWWTNTGIVFLGVRGVEYLIDARIHQRVVEALYDALVEDLGPLTPPGE